MNRFLRIEYAGGERQYLRFSEIESITASTTESPEDSDERKAGHPYQVRIVFMTRNGRDTVVSFGFDENRQINLKRLLKNLTICL